jgi:hypothetical protein
LRDISHFTEAFFYTNSIVKSGTGGIFKKEKNLKKIVNPTKTFFRVWLMNIFVNAEYQTFTQQMEEFSVFDVNREAQDAALQVCLQ